MVLVFASYEVERHMMVKLFTDSGDTVDIPIVPYVDWMAEMAQAIWRDSIALVIFGDHRPRRGRLPRVQRFRARARARR